MAAPSYAPSSQAPRGERAEPQPILRTERVIAVTLGAIRVVQHLPFIAVSIGGWTAYSRPALMGWLFVLSLAWTLFLFTFAYRRGGLPPRSRAQMSRLPR